MTSASTSNPLVPWPADGNVAAMHAAVERLFRASDAASVLEICEAMLGELGIGGRLHWRLIGDEPSSSGSTQLDLAEDPQGLRTLVLELPDAVTPDSLYDHLAWLGRLSASRLRQLAETSRLYEAISRLALAERLQRALYAIADQASAEHNMTEMMHSLHAILGSLMYAENFYIVLYDAATDSVRFPYYVDTMDKEPPSPDESVPLQEMRAQPDLEPVAVRPGDHGFGRRTDPAVPRPLRAVGAGVRTLAGRAAAARMAAWWEAS